jgi:RimJ/RimL family protein N-acetyltransferase
MLGGVREAPTLDTDRLRLRAHRADDLHDCAEMWADPEVTRFIGGRPFTKEETWTKILRYAGHWSLLGYGYWVITDKAKSRFVGEVGFADFKREIDPPLDGPELGFALARWAHRQGFATEAVLAAHAWLTMRCGAVRTSCLIDPGHTASVRVVEKCGYRELRRATYKGSPTVVFERDVPRNDVA